MLRIRAVLSLLREPPLPVLLAITLCGWVAMAAFGQEAMMSAFCMRVTGAWYDQGWRALQAALFLTSPIQIGSSWLLMLVAMMTPILAGPIDHIWQRSLSRRRWRGIALFLAGYAAIWLAVAPIIAAAVILLRVASGVIGVPPELPALAVAFAWQASPAKQFCLNHCHWTPRLSAFGWAADRDCLRYGLVNAGWCVGTCWALTLASLAATAAHLPIMALMSATMIADRLRAGRPARWRVPLLARFAAWRSSRAETRYSGKNARPIFSTTAMLRTGAPREN